MSEATVLLGARLKDVRTRRMETLAVVAKRSGLTAGFLSKLENGYTEISIGALLRLCKALEVELTELTDGPTGRLVKAADLKPVGYGGEGLLDYLLTPFDERRIQVQLSEVEPGGGSGDEQYELPVDVEFVHLISGRLTVTVDTVDYELRAGDSLTFSRLPHKFHNPGTTRARMIWAFSPALPARDE